MQRLVWGVVAAALLAGCSPEPEEKPQGVIPQYQLDALEKAKGVEQQLQDAQKQQLQQLQQQGG